MNRVAPVPKMQTKPISAQMDWNGRTRCNPNVIERIKRMVQAKPANKKCRAFFIIVYFMRQM